MRAIIYKEFAKIKIVFFAFLLLAIFNSLVVIFAARSGILSVSNVVYIDSVVYEAKFSFSNLDILNIFFSALIASTAFFYERLNGRIRIQFHFPLSNFANLSVISLIPLGFVLFVFFVEFIILFTCFCIYFPPQIYAVLLEILFFNFLFCICVFFGFLSVILEPNLKRAALFLISWAILICFYFFINPDFYKIKSYDFNQDFYKFWIFCLVFGVCSLVKSFDDYKKGYIK